jgi:protein-disulfide isomerase
VKREALRLGLIAALLLAGFALAASYYSSQRATPEPAPVTTTEPAQVDPGRANPSHANPSHAHPSHADPSHGNPSGAGQGQVTPAESPALVRPHSPTLGPDDAKVTVVEFLDPECEACRAMYPIVKHVLGEFPDQVRLVVRYVPLHPNSIYAAGVLEAARAQGRYWEMLETLFQHQPEWGSHHAPRPELIPGYAEKLGLDMQALERSLEAREHERLVATDHADAKALGVTGTPSFFVNGQRLQRLGYPPLKALVERELSR